MESNNEKIQLGQILSSLKVIDLTCEGEALARHNKQVVFIDKGLPGEILHAKVTAIKKRIIHAERLETLQPSPDAIAPQCPHAVECGGCTWQNLKLSAQHTWKMNHLQQSLTRIAKVALPQIAPLVPSPDTLYYRNKMVFAFMPDAQGKTQVGLRKSKSHDVVAVTDCCLQPKIAMNILQEIRAFLEKNHISAYNGEQGFLRFLVIHTPDYMPEYGPNHTQNTIPQTFVEIITAPKYGNESYTAPVCALADHLFKTSRLGLCGVAITARKQKSNVAQGDYKVFSLGELTYKEQFNHLSVKVPYNAFLQRNTKAACVLYKTIATQASLQGHEIVWDLYCGIGSIGLYLAPKAKAIRGFDIQTEAIFAATTNAQENGYPQCLFHAGNILQQMRAETTKPDIIIVDPPRAGVDAQILKHMSNSGAKKIIYVSCDVSTQARDVARLQPFWRITKSIPFDMFPHTPHLENILVLEPA